jgi:AcrR family transcriptional regulator
MSTAVDPRVARTRDVVICAACELLVAEGHHGITIDGIARRTGVARTTIYRHWPTIADLVDDAMRAMSQPKRIPDTGSVHRDVVEHLSNLARSLRSDDWGQVLPTLIDASFRNDDMASHQDAIVRERRALLATILQRGVERGELSADAPIDELIDRLLGPLFMRHLIVRTPTNRAYVERLAAATLHTAQR